jgi:hypothetical protein
VTAAAMRSETAAPAARALAIDARGVAVMTSHALRSFP